MKDSDRATMTKINDAQPGDDEEVPSKLMEIVDKREDERRSRGERRYFHSGGADDPERRAASRRISVRRASDKTAIDKGNVDKE